LVSVVPGSVDFLTAATGPENIALQKFATRSNGKYFLESFAKVLFLRQRKFISTERMLLDNAEC
jgi:hypothetical protein